MIVLGLLMVMDRVANIKVMSRNVGQTLQPSRCHDILQHFVCSLQSVCCTLHLQQIRGSWGEKH